MKKLLFQKILLISQIEKKARSVEFDAKTTTITGSNDTGKSCLLKSLFRCFGAETRTHQRWENSKVIKLLFFSIDDINYSVLQNGNYYSYFNSDHVIEKSFTGITWDYCTFFANRFNFNIQLPNSNGDMVNLPPSYFFLPFYVDQDRSWMKNWDGFKKLSRIPNWRQSLVEYHTGIHPNSYYELISQMRQEDLRLKELLLEHKVQVNILKKLEKESVVEFNVDLDEFRNEISKLLVSYNQLNKKQNQYKNNLIKLNNLRIQLESQREIVQKSLKEIKADIKYANDVLIDDHIQCPTCGAEYENGFTERFSIAQDEDRCYELLVELDAERKQVLHNIEEAESTYTSCTKEAEEIQEILSFKRQQVELGTLLEIQAKNRARANIREDIDTTMRAIRTIELEIETLQNKKKAFAKSDRRKTILREYHETMRSFLFGVDVHTLDQNDCHRIDTFINEMGSDLPRSYLAYYYAILSIIKKHGSAVYSPIVIDAPNQQGQDKTSMSRILNFIRDNQPGGTQMILGTEDLWGVKMPGKQIVLDEKYSLLSRCEYENVLNVMKPYLDQSLMVVENG